MSRTSQVASSARRIHTGLVEFVSGKEHGIIVHTYINIIIYIDIDMIYYIIIQLNYRWYNDETGLPVSLFPLAFIQFRNITDLEPWKLQDLRTSTNLRREELASAIALLSQASEQEVLAKYRPLDHPGSSNSLGHQNGTSGDGWRWTLIDPWDFALSSGNMWQSQRSCAPAFTLKPPSLQLPTFFFDVKWCRP